MSTLRTLFISAALGVVLAVLGVAATMTVVDSTAAEVVRETAGETDSDPGTPPTFYGTR